MDNEILSKIRKLNWVLSESTTGYFSFNDLCEILSELMDSNTYILNARGKILAAVYEEGEEAPLIRDAETGKETLPKSYNDKLLEINETKANLSDDEIKEIYGADYEMSNKYHTIVPIIFGGNRIATLEMARRGKAYNDEDIALCEYGATVVGIEVSRGIALEEEEENRLKNAVHMALETLSYSELDAVTKIFAELEGEEGLLVASKIADKSGITRSVIVNALRKLESAGVIESRSLGMKGTRIKVTNEYLKNEVDRIEI
jgi:transcriptional pleiotropic repressor